MLTQVQAFQDFIGGDYLFPGVSRQGDPYSITDALVEKGADLSMGDQEGWTALHFAAAKDHVAIAKLLIEKGAKVNAPSTRGGRPLHEAAASAGREMLELLLEKGADKSIKATNGKTALDYALELENKAAAEVLR